MIFNRRHACLKPSRATQNQKNCILLVRSSLGNKGNGTPAVRIARQDVSLGEQLMHDAASQVTVCHTTDVQSAIAAGCRALGRAPGTAEAKLVSGCAPMVVQTATMQGLTWFASTMLLHRCRMHGPWHMVYVNMARTNHTSWD